MDKRKYKVLLVEDDQDQVDYFLSQINQTNLEVSIAGCREEANFFLKNDFDFIMTDLQIPFRKGDLPRARFGEFVFEDCLKILTEGCCKGIALVSNFEHHLVKDQSDINIEKFKFLKNFSHKRNSSISFERKSNGLNFIAWFDEVWYMHSLFLIKGQSIDYGGEKPPESLQSLLHAGEAKMLKPYKQILEALIKG